MNSILVEAKYYEEKQIKEDGQAIVWGREMRFWIGWPVKASLSGDHWAISEGGDEASLAAI